MTDPATLRAAAEARLAARPRPAEGKDAARLLHELQVHQVELEMQNEMLAEALQARTAFLNRITHEFRTPLNSIIGFADLLQAGLAGPVTARQAAYAADILAGGLRLKALVDGILAQSREFDDRL